MIVLYVVLHDRALVCFMILLYSVLHDRECFVVVLRSVLHDRAPQSVCFMLSLFRLIKTVGSTNTEIVKSFRKIFSIALSYMLYAKPFTYKHGLGALLFVVSICLGVFMRMQRSTNTIKNKPRGVVHRA